MSGLERALPPNWSLDVNESSIGIYRVLAMAKDGRRIEVTAFDDDVERKTKEVIESIYDSDRQVAERHTRSQ